MLTTIEINRLSDISEDEQVDIDRIIQAAERLLQTASMERSRINCNMVKHNFTESVMTWLTKPSPFYVKK
ncbi:MAG: hypothetical protein ABRQ38_13575 [Candidatus Eremiobacterota bacterium]